MNSDRDRIEGMIAARVAPKTHPRLPQQDRSHVADLDAAFATLAKADADLMPGIIGLFQVLPYETVEEIRRYAELILAARSLPGQALPRYR